MSQIQNYYPDRFHSDDENLEEYNQYIQQELSRIANHLRIISDGQMDQVNVVPSKPRDGMMRLADGTNWDPGSGEGLYAYYASAWNLLGVPDAVTVNDTLSVSGAAVLQGTLTVSGAVVLKSSLTVEGDATINGLMPTGSIIPYGGSTSPTNFLLCDGSQYTATGSYSVLYSVIGYNYGGSAGSGMFAVPDIRGRVPLGKDDMGGSSANRVTASEADNLGQGSGAENHTLTTAELAVHSHYYYDNAAGGSWRPLLIYGNYAGGPSNSSNAGSGSAHNNMQPYQTVNYIIKT